MRTSLAVLLLAIVSAGRAQPTAQPGRLTEGLACPSDPSQTYTIYLPSTYTATRTWPVLFVFDPGGRGARAAEVFRDAAEKYGWIVVGSENSRNGPWEPTRRAVTAMWPAVMQGYAVNRDRVYAGGHSGGASVAWTLASETGQIAGVIGSGEPNPPPESKVGGFAWFGTAGHADFNFIEVRTIDARVARAGAPHRVEHFDGGHQWLPAPLTIAALGWLEVVAMKQKRRPTDAALAAAILAGDMARARDLESAGLVTEAHRTYTAIVETFGGLVDAGEAAAKIKALEASDQFRKARRDEQRSDDRERARVETLVGFMSRLASADPDTMAALGRTLNLPDLQKAARGTGYEADSARRSLDTIFMQTAGDLPRQFEQQKEYARAAVALDVAAEIHPDRPRVWVDLAAARAQSGAKSAAIEALQKAIGAGYTDKAALASDPRFASLRNVPAFTKLLQ
jgi:hypothetical protein